MSLALAGTRNCVWRRDEASLLWDWRPDLREYPDRVWLFGCLLAVSC